MSQPIQFVTEPPRLKHGQPRIDWPSIAERLKAHPNEWARLDDVARSTAQQIRLGKVAALRPPEAYEVTNRTDETCQPGRTNLFIRYIGGQA